MQQNKWPLFADIRISNFRVSDFLFRCCTFDPHAATEHMQRNTWPLPVEIEISNFRAAIVVPHTRRMEQGLYSDIFSRFLNMHTNVSYYRYTLIVAFGFILMVLKSY